MEDNLSQTTKPFRFASLKLRSSLTANSPLAALSKLPNGVRIERTCDVWEVQLASHLAAVHDNELDKALNRAIEQMQIDEGLKKEA